LVWIEKEQLVTLGAFIEQAVAQVDPEEAAKVEHFFPTGPIADFPLNPTVEFRLGQLRFGHDTTNQQFVLMALDTEAAAEDKDAMPTLQFRASYRSGHRLSRQIEALASAGRPRCPLCDQPLGPEPHHCAISNGHIH
jgi:uncharacterized repeat protein (TIGR03847 family)